MQGLDAVPAAWCRPGSITSHSLEPRSTPRTTFTHFHKTNQQIRNPKSNLRRLTTQYKHPKPRTSTSSSAATRQQHRNQTNHQPHRALRRLLHLHRRALRRKSADPNLDLGNSRPQPRKEDDFDRSEQYSKPARECHGALLLRAER